MTNDANDSSFTISTTPSEFCGCPSSTGVTQIAGCLHRGVDLQWWRGCGNLCHRLDEATYNTIAPVSGKLFTITVPKLLSLNGICDGAHPMKVKQIGDDTQGAALVEFAIALPLFTTLIFGLIWLGLVMWTQFSLQRSVGLAARCATVALIREHHQGGLQHCKRCSATYRQRH